MKKFRIIGIALITVFVMIFSWYLVDRFSCSKLLPYYSINMSEKDTVLTIGIIGDSWVTRDKIGSLLHASLQEKGYANKTISSGHLGAKSKLVYQNLFKEDNQKHSSKFVIESRPDYCIVIAGVNDAASQIGAHYYSFHMVHIIKTLLHYKIKPIIVSLPEFGVEEVIENMNFLSRNRNVISAYFNNNGELDNIILYRKTFIEELELEKLSDSVIHINFDNVCSDYKRCLTLYSNPSHLSKKGNLKFTHVIANKLIGIINTQ